MTTPIRYDNQVVLVTGSSRGLGSEFARCLGDAGATVIINDTQSSERGQATCAALIASGVNAHYVPGNVTAAQELVRQVIAITGRIDAIVHNAGIVRDKTLRKMSQEQWQEVMQVHLDAAFNLSQAAWPYFEEQGCGRLVFLSSASGLYGNFGQANYAAAKAGMYGLCRSIQLEGAATNINANCVAPFGATEMNSANMDDAMKAIIKAEYIAPLVAYLCHPSCTESGGLFEASAGAYKKVRWERSMGLRLNPMDGISIEDIAENWSQVIDFSDSEHPTDMRDSLRRMWEAPGEPNT